MGQSSCWRWWSGAAVNCRFFLHEKGGRWWWFGELCSQEGRGVGNDFWRQVGCVLMVNFVCFFAKVFFW